MKRILVTIGIFYTLTANAQNYLISFAGIGASSTVNGVKVENLMAGTTLTLNGNDILHLTGPTGIHSPEYKLSSELKIYPNPMTENSLMEVYPPVGGDAEIAVYDMTGRQLSQQRSYLEKSGQQFRLSGFRDGLYLISVKGNNYQISGQLLCRVNSGGTISIDKVSNNIQSPDKGKSEADIKGTESTVDMLYTTGDRLKFTGTSGIYSTVITDVPSADKTITFNFIACTDGDGNNYPSVQIGTQVWMAENLKTKKYNDGTDITLVTDNSAWTKLTIPGYCWYNNDEAGYKNTYGALYNWYAVNYGKLCPVGWHAPSFDEWETLITYLGSWEVAGGKMKETGTAHWNPNTGATNETGFTALPGGQRGNSGYFFDLGYFGGYWWSATEAWYRVIECRNISISSLAERETIGFSVRCIKGELGPVGLPEVTTLPISNVTTTGASSGGRVKSDVGASITARGVCWSTVTNPTIADAKTSDGTGAGPFTSSIEGLSINKVYYLRAYAINDAGTAYGDQVILKTMTGMVTDIDGNIYYSVSIGSQEWMSANLKVTRYRNGDQIPNITDYTQWDPLTTGARSTNIHLTNYAATYGWFYNWYAVADSRKVCPTGWHVPNDAEWTTLTSYLGGESIAGGKLKEAGTIHWVDPNSGATNETGFMALPGEAYLASPGWMGPGYAGFWWTSSQFDAAEAWNRVLFNTDATVSRVNNSKKSGFSVRCIKD